MATGFGAMFLCRLGVGVGEAGGVAPSYALISQTFPPEKRARALAVYSLGIPIGSALGFLLGGYIAANVNWRAAFITIGLAGVLFTPIFAATIREPAAPQATAQAHDSAIRFADVFKILAAKRSFWLLSFGAAAGSMMGYGLAVWLPSAIQLSFSLTLIQTAQFFGALLLTGGIIGVLAGGWIADRLGAANRGAYAKMPAVAYAIGAPFFVAGLYSGSAAAAFALFLLPQALVYLWLAPVLTAVQHLVPAPMRATASASFLLINNLIGVGFGAPLIGFVSDLLKPAYGAESLRLAITLGLGCYLLAAVLMALAGRYLQREWVD
jgi:MFS family permease